MLCQEIMSEPVHMAAKGDSVQEVALKMRDANIGFLPVCDKKGGLIGVVTDRDLALRICIDNLKAKKTAVEEIMTRAAITCRGTDEIQRAQELMFAHRKSRIVVVGASGTPIGVISLSDLPGRAPFTAEMLAEIASRELRH